MDSKALQDLGWFAAIIVILFIMWAAAGGKDRTVDKVLNVRTVTGDQRAIRGLNVPMLPSLPSGGEYSSGGSGNGNGTNVGSGGSGDNYSYPFSTTRSDVLGSKQSQYFNKIALRYGNTGSTNPESEYIVIEANKGNPGGINITGWTLVSTSTGKMASVGKGVVLPLLTDNNAREDIYLAPGDKAYLNTGVSPTTYSFRSNKCIGYFSERYSFTPSLSYSCPRISELPTPPPPNNFSDSCMDYIQSFPACTSIQRYASSNVDQKCKNFIEEEARYDRCVFNNKKDLSFYDKEWRVYLGKNAELWKSSRETIQLLDQYGKIVDQITY